MASIKQIFGKINPEIYAENGKELLAKYGSAEKIPADEVKEKSLGEHRIVYDSSSETLEPLYFFILDMLENRGMSPEKIVDNFASSPGSGHFAELGQRATVMQQQGSKILGDVNTVLRSVLNLIYDLKEFRIRLESYDDLKDKSKAEGATLSLKQIWMDKVDINKGNSSIKAMAFQGGFQTLIHAFLAVKDEKDVDKVDLNDVVKRILKPRIQEFNIWLEQSEKELRKRYELEKTYLRSQVNSLKLYARWAKPYLKAAQQLEMKDMSRNASLVKGFNTIIFELSLLGKTKLNVEESVLKGDLPLDFKKMKMKRDYFSCTLVEFKFRGIPQRVSQQSHYVFGGKAEISFNAYSLNSDELKVLDQEMLKSDIEDVLKLVEGVTTESMNQLQEEINFFLEEKSAEEKNKSAWKMDDSNPILALFGFYDKNKEAKPEKNVKEEIKVSNPDNWIEKTHLRKLATRSAEDTTFDIFDVYKKQHGMPSYT